MHSTRILTLLFLFITLSIHAHAQSTYKVQAYDDVTSNIQSIDRIAQDKTGFIWLSSSDGLYRFDGYELRGYRPTDADGVNISSDEIDRMHADKEGNLWCVIDNHAYMFNTHSYAFHEVLATLEKNTGKTFVVRNIRPVNDREMIILCDNGIAIATTTADAGKSARIIISDGSEEINMNVRNGEAWLMTTKQNYLYSNGKCRITDKKFANTPVNTAFHTDRFGKQWQRENIDAPGLDKARMIFKDNQDNVWYLHERRLIRISFYPTLYTRLENETQPMRCAMVDNKQRTWVANRNNKLLAIYDKQNNLEGYLAADGTISKKPAEFRSLVYAMLQDAYGNIWIGTKPHGLYRLKESANGKYSIENYREDTEGIHDNEIIGLVKDQHGVIWACGFREGLIRITHPNAEHPTFKAIPNVVQKQTPTQVKFRQIIPTRSDAILAATSAGLIVYNIGMPIKQLQHGKGITLHQKEAGRASSLGCTPLKSLIETTDGRIYICTRDKGIDLLTSENIFAKTLTFSHFRTSNGFPTNYPKSITEIGGTLWVTALNTMIEWHPDTPLPTGASTKLFIEGSDFGECTPVQRADGTWIYGDMSGAIAIDIKHLEKAGAGEQAGKLPIVLTSELDSDTIRLGKNERTLSLSFATLDYGDANKLNYAVRLLRDNNDEWQFLGQAHDIVFHNLEPGEYVLQIRSTNSSGEWMDTERTVRVIVTPKFKETTVAQFLMALIVVLMLLAAFYIWRHIRRLDQKHRETLDAYLQLLNHNQQQTNREHEEYRMQLLENARVEPQNDKFIKKVVEYIDMHISNADIDIDSMAQHAAVSRSHLNHKLKQILGVTPSEMIREARIKHARMLLEDPNRSVNDVAYACGFTDPKYFSKCFKASTGMSPTKYRLTR